MPRQLPDCFYPLPGPEEEARAERIVLPMLKTAEGRADFLLRLSGQAEVIMAAGYQIAPQAAQDCLACLNHVVSLCDGTEVYDRAVVDRFRRKLAERLPS